MKRLPILLLALISGVILVLGWMLYQRSQWSGGVNLVDVGADVRKLIAERGDQRKLEGEGLIRIALDEQLAETFFPSIKLKRDIYDPQTYFRTRPGFSAQRKFSEHSDGGWPVHFNQAGFKSDRELMNPRPDVRVLITGDSHSEGVVPTPENYCSQLELLLSEANVARSAEVLNAARGGYMLYNYLGVLEKYADLQPDVFVMSIFGGNDFSETVPLYGYFEGVNLDDLRQGWAAKVTTGEGAGPRSAAALSQGMHQEVLFHHSPKWREIALTAAIEITAEVAAQCAARDIEFILMYIPPVMDVQLRYCDEAVAQVLEVFEMDADDRGLTEQMADQYLGALSSAGVRIVDLRDAYRAEPESIYWESDYHIKMRAHRIAAEQLHAAVESALSQ